MSREFRERIAAFPMGATSLSLTMIDALRRSGRPGEASALVEEMVSHARDVGELLFEPELIRLRGELIEPIDPGAAAASYREAIALARAAGEPSLELRAALRLTSLPATADERAAALDQLAAALANMTAAPRRRT